MSDAPPIPTGPRAGSNAKGSKPKRVRKPRGDKPKDKDTSNAHGPSQASKPELTPKAESKKHKEESSSRKKQAESSSKRKEKEQSKKKEKRASQGSAPKPRLKVIVRRLPPNLPEQVFWNSVAQWVRLDPVKDAATATQDKTPQEAGNQKLENGNQHKEKDLQQVGGSATIGSDNLAAALPSTVDWQKFVKGKLSDNPTGTKPSVCSRAYIRFKDPATLVQFSKSFDGHIFRDSKGNESIAVVEFAPYQRCPGETLGGPGSGKKAKKDNRMGTIEEDPDYQKFLASLEANESTQDPTEKSDTQLMSHLTSTPQELKEKSKSTPLLDFLRNQQLEKKALLIQNRSNSNKKAGGSKNASTSSSSGLSRNQALDIANRQIMSQLSQVSKDARKRVGDSDVVAGKTYGAKAFGDEPSSSARTAEGKEGAGVAENLSSIRKTKEKEKERDGDKGKNGKEEAKGGKGKEKTREKEQTKKKELDGKPAAEGKEKRKERQQEKDKVRVKSSESPSAPGSKEKAAHAPVTTATEIPKGPKKDKEKNPKPKGQEYRQGQGQGQGQGKQSKTSTVGGGKGAGGGSSTEKQPPSISQAPLAILKRDDGLPASATAKREPSSGDAERQHSTSHSTAPNPLPILVSIPTGPKNSNHNVKRGHGNLSSDGGGQGHGAGPGGSSKNKYKSQGQRQDQTQAQPQKQKP